MRRVVRPPVPVPVGPPLNLTAGLVTADVVGGRLADGSDTAPEAEGQDIRPWVGLAGPFTARSAPLARGTVPGSSSGPAAPGVGG